MACGTIFKIYHLMSLKKSKGRLSYADKHWAKGEEWYGGKHVNKRCESLFLDLWCRWFCWPIRKIRWLRPYWRTIYSELIFPNKVFILSLKQFHYFRGEVLISQFIVVESGDEELEDSDDESVKNFIGDMGVEFLVDPEDDASSKSTTVRNIFLKTNPRTWR